MSVIAGPSSPKFLDLHFAEIVISNQFMYFCKGKSPLLS